MTVDISERRQQEKDLERQRDELATLDRLNRTLLETTRELVRTGNREVIERTVCTQLADSELYQFAWTGERSLDGDRIVPRTTAGDDAGHLDAHGTDTEGIDDELEAADRAIRTGKVAVVTPDESGTGPGQDAASGRDFESVAAVPFHHDGTVYGVLTVSTERKDAFSAREQDGFDVLGRTVGFIINAVRNHRLLFADAVVELEFNVPDADSAFADIAVDLDCEIELTGHIAERDRWVLYFDVEGAPLADVVEAARGKPSVDRARVIGENAEHGGIEMIIVAPPLLQTLSHAGAAVRSAVADPDGARLVVEVPIDADVRGVVEHVRCEHPAAELVAQRDRDHEISAVGHPDGVFDELTDRQREVLEAAYRAGYYTWPRESTAKEVADSLNLAHSTLHGHLRKAETVIFSSLFSDG